MVYNFGSVQLAKGTQYMLLGSTTNSTTNLDAAAMRLGLDTGNPYAGGATTQSSDWDAEFQVQHTASAWTGKLTIANNGFDADAAAALSTANITSTTPTDWTWNNTGLRGMYRNVEPTIGLHSGGVVQGAQLSQTLTETLAANTKYLLSAYAHFGTSSASESTDWSIGLYANGVLLGELDESFNTAQVPNNQGYIDDLAPSVGSPNMSIEIDPSLVGGVSVGDALEIRIINNSTGTWIHPDEINVLTQVIPEPATMSLLALGGVAMLKRRKK